MPSLRPTKCPHWGQQNALTEVKGGKSLDGSCSLCVKYAHNLSIPEAFRIMQRVYLEMSLQNCSDENIACSC